MRIVNKKEFYKLPEGTLYAEYRPQIFSELNIKYQNLFNNNGEPIDFIYVPLLGNVDCESSSDLFDILCKCEEDGSSFKLDFECGNRDGLYEDDSLYAIYEKEDIQSFIEKLELCKSIFKSVDGF